MKNNLILKKVEQVAVNSASKRRFYENVQKGDFVSIIYYDVEKEQVRLHPSEILRYA